MTSPFLGIFQILQYKIQCLMLLVPNPSPIAIPGPEAIASKSNCCSASDITLAICSGWAVCINWYQLLSAASANCRAKILSHGSCWRNRLAETARLKDTYHFLQVIGDDTRPFRQCHDNIGQFDQVVALCLIPYALLFAILFLCKTRNLTRRQIMLYFCRGAACKQRR